MKNVFIVFLVLSSVLLTSCATIFNGTKQKISFTSVPSGAAVVVRGEQVAITPATVRIKRNTQTIVFVKEGYQTEVFNVNHNTSSWFYGNLNFVWMGTLLIWDYGYLWGALMTETGMAIDNSTGASFRIPYKLISAELKTVDCGK
jgi:hypothetical protein